MGLGWTPGGKRTVTDHAAGFLNGPGRDRLCDLVPWRDAHGLLFDGPCDGMSGDGHSFNIKARHNDQRLGIFPTGEVLDATTPSIRIGCMVRVVIQERIQMTMI